MNPEPERRSGKGGLLTAGLMLAGCLGFKILIFAGGFAAIGAALGNSAVLVVAGLLVSAAGGALLWRRHRRHRRAADAQQPPPHRSEVRT